MSRLKISTKIKVHKIQLSIKKPEKMLLLSDIYLQTAFSRLFVDKILSQFCEFGLSTYFNIFLQEYFFRLY